MHIEPLSSTASATEDEPTPTSTLAPQPLPTLETGLNHESPIALATQDPPLAAPQPGEGGSTLNQLINPAPTLGVQLPVLHSLSAGENHQLSTINHQLTPTVIDAKPLLPATVQRRKARRNGRVASLPKLQRDMVNRMLWNSVPYKNVAAALHDAGFNITERNISNWATGGYLEWRFEQDLVLQNRLDQDHLVDHLRRDDAAELPEVGLQAAATRLSQILVQKTARGDELETNIGTFSQMVDVLCRLNREIGILQKQRDDSRRTLGPAYDAARIKQTDQKSALESEWFFSDPDSDSGLEKPAVPPLLPPVPTSRTLEIADLEDAVRKQRARNEEFRTMMQALSAKKAPPAKEAASQPLPGNGAASEPAPQPPTAPPHSNRTVGHGSLR